MCVSCTLYTEEFLAVIVAVDVILLMPPGTEDEVWQCFGRALCG